MSLVGWWWRACESMVRWNGTGVKQVGEVRWAGYFLLFYRVSDRSNSVVRLKTHHFSELTAECHLINEYRIRSQCSSLNLPNISSTQPLIAIATYLTSMVLVATLVRANPMDGFYTTLQPTLLAGNQALHGW